jgi:hypothetical protein
MKVIYDQTIVFASSPTDSSKMAETPAPMRPGFLLEPGGQDYIGQNSYDMALFGEEGNL